MVKVPAEGFGIGSERRGRSVGPRWMLIVEEGEVDDEEGIVGTTE
jgi:hypothetical protein